MVPLCSSATANGGYGPGSRASVLGAVYDLRRDHIPHDPAMVVENGLVDALVGATVWSRRAILVAPARPSTGVWQGCQFAYDGVSSEKGAR